MKAFFNRFVVNPPFAIKLSVTELVGVYNRVRKSALAEILTDVRRQRLVALLNYAGVKGGCLSRLRSVLKRWLVAKMFHQRFQVAFRPAFLAVVLRCLWIEVPMRLVTSAVLVAIRKRAFGHELPTDFAELDAFLRQVFCNGFHIG